MSAATRPPAAAPPPKIPPESELEAHLGHEWRVARFSNLMPRRVEEVLLVSSAYDSFILEEDGLLTEMVFSEYTDLSLTHAPRVTHVSAATEALRLLETRRFDLVITMLRLGDMELKDFSAAVRALNHELPIILLIANEIELDRLGDRAALDVDSIYVWHGDAKLFLAMIKATEDQWNAEHDTREGGVGVIIVIEDSVRYRSSLLPMLYSEIVEQTRAVMAEGINRVQRQLRLRARPKILHADTFSGGMELFRRHSEYLFGVITDVAFALRPDGPEDEHAGIRFIEAIRELAPQADVPALLQSSEAKNRIEADRIQTRFLYKRSNTLQQDIRSFMKLNFGFGEFVFRDPKTQEEVARASDLYEMVHVLESVPLESLNYHASRNHFSNWLRARTEFGLAKIVRPLQAGDFPNWEALRRYLISAFQAALRLNRRGVVEDFSRARFDPTMSFARIGGGTLGGKARGLAFVDSLLARQGLDHRFENVAISVPRSVVIGTDAFDRFLDANGLRSAALHQQSDDRIQHAFLQARLPDFVVEHLTAYVSAVTQPIAVRSSSLLEDSQYYPFAGVYDTYMLPNNHAEPAVRLQQLMDAIRLVFASTFFAAARKYLESTPHRIEEQSMAVLLQQIVGRQREGYFYPDFAGVVRSYNFYPFGGTRPEEGVASVALGLGKTVVDGGDALRFCPTRPHVLPQLATPTQFLQQSQRSFYAIDLNNPNIAVMPGADGMLAQLELDVAERHGTLAAVGSVWSQEDQCFYDGIHRPGPRVVTFAHILKSGLFPLAEVLRAVLELGQQGMNTPVEVEFAVNVDTRPRQLAILQMRPYGAAGDFEPVELAGLPRDLLLCETTQALGNGVIGGIRDAIYVKPRAFDAACTREIATEISALNEQLKREGRPYLLIGPGRWGSSNRWLGIPVSWPQISAARIIIETTLDNFIVDPSQGSHFFHNLTAVGTAYFTVNQRLGGGFIDWNWLDAQPAARETQYLRHVRTEIPLEARIDGRTSHAAVLKWSARADGEPGAR